MLKTTLLILAALSLAGPTSAAGSKSVKDWTGVCDNRRTCAVFGFVPDGEESLGYLKISRDGGPLAPVRISLTRPLDEPARGGSWTLLADGKVIAGLGPLRAVAGESGERAQLTGTPAAVLIAALRNATALQVLADGKPAFTVSLAGSAAMLLWMDDQQGRVGTLSALVRKGPKPAAAVPPPLPTPAVSAAPPVSQAGLPNKPPTARFKRLIASLDDCDTGESQTDFEPVIARLAPGVVLWGPVCSHGAYNVLNVFFVGDEAAKTVRRITFPEGPGSGQARDETLMNVTFDPRTQTLSTLSKARGLGDCGEAASWVWDGAAFQLLGETIMPQCRGVTPDDWPSLYVARRR